MLDNLQLLFVYAPVMNVQMIFVAFLLGQFLPLYGLALVWGVMNVKNLAQGDFVIMEATGIFALQHGHASNRSTTHCCSAYVFVWLIDYLLIIKE